MLYRILGILLNCITIFNCLTAESVLKENEKYSKSSLQICIEGFDVYKDKIIRTEESRKMGAKYLKEIDLESREECLRLCCETNQCDVFIFEEKKPGSCYLFHCGPPDDFKCKFTNHANYSSAVLTVNPTELEQQIQRTQQEHELKSLRKLADPVPIGYVTEPTVILVATQAPKTSVSSTPTFIKTACSRNQFECRTSGDCIAIYNACDGIPQCADGSDEAAELGCPTERPTFSPSSPIQPLPPPLPPSSNSLKYQQIDQRHKPYVPLYERGPEKDSKLWQSSALSHQLISQQQRLQYPAQVVMSQPQISLDSQNYRWDYQPLYGPNRGAYNSINSFHEQNNLSPYEQGQPHIFNHKGPSVIGEGGGEGSVFPDPNRQYTSYFPPPDRGVWQENQQPQSLPSVTPNLQNSKSVELQGQLEITASLPPCKPTDKEVEISLKNDIHDKIDIKVQKSTYTKNVNTQSNKKTIVLESDNVKHTYLSPETKKAQDQKDQQKSSEDHPAEIEKSLIVAYLQQENNDMKILKPKGAVISLALGLSVTALMAALIACRLRVIRRRGRRGHGPHTHDADYLVNGMYL